jgi:hypothetical protein
VRIIHNWKAKHSRPGENPLQVLREAIETNTAVQLPRTARIRVSMGRGTCIGLLPGDQWFAYVGFLPGEEGLALQPERNR